MEDHTKSSLCVVCRSSEWVREGKRDGYVLAICRNCDLTFTLNPDYQTALYETAYDPGGSEGAATPLLPQRHYAAPMFRMEMERSAYLKPPPRLTPAQKSALKWLKANAPPGSTIVDLGCGAGRFLRALKKARFDGVGVDVSPRLVDLLNDLGLRAEVGTAPDFTWHGTTPFAITIFEVLEHLPDPLPVLDDLRRRFPDAHVLASVPSPFRASVILRGAHGSADYPPHHFLRWTPKSLKIAFAAVGYGRTDVTLPPPVGDEFVPGLGQLLSKVRGRSSPRDPARGGPGHGAQRRSSRGGLAATLILIAHFSYRISARAVGAIPASRARKRGATAASMLVRASP